MPVTPPPATAPMVDDRDIVTPPWNAYFQQITTASDSTISTNIANAQAAANAAQTSANNVAADLAALGASFPGGLIGDYRQTAVANLGPTWLLCDGTGYASANYPDLAALLGGVTGTGGQPTFATPTIPPVYDSFNPTTPVMRTFIRAL